MMNLKFDKQAQVRTYLQVLTVYEFDGFSEKRQILFYINFSGNTLCARKEEK